MSVVTFEPIVLGGTKPKSTRGIIPKSLDIISSVLLEPTTFIKSPTAAGEKVAARRAKISSGDKKEAGKVIAETLTATTLAAGAILGGSQAAAAGGLKGIARLGLKVVPKTFKGQAALATGAGILITSPTAREFAGNIVQDPTALGREAGRIIEKSKKGDKLPAVGEALKTAGLVGAGVVTGAGLLAGGKKAVDFIKTKTPVVKSPSNTPTAEALPVSSVPDSLAPISDAPVVSSPPKPETAAVASPVTVKVMNKPQINVAVAQ